MAYNLKRTGWNATCSLDIRNPILDALVQIDTKPKTDKPFIDLTLGDPTKNPALQPHSVLIDAVTAALHSGKFNGYGPMEGNFDARSAVAEFYTSEADGVRYNPRDVVLTNGASEAIDMVITTICEPGSNVLFPRPGFAYCVSTEARHVEDRYYNLLPDREWEVDFAHLETLIDSKTRAIMITNPSNPCGSNFSREHLRDILAFAARHYLPVISDEIYGEMVFAGEHFHPLANVNASLSSAHDPALANGHATPAPATSVPLITIGGIAKRWLVPGWRLGWILVHDPAGRFGFDVRRVLKDVATVALAPCSLVQGAIPTILRSTPAAFYTDTMALLEDHARLLAEQLGDVKGLRVVKPRGALYIMVGVDPEAFEGVKDEWEFVQRLVWEEAVFPVPGRCFRFEGFMRIVTATRRDHLEEACRRLRAFCERHRKRT